MIKDSDAAEQLVHEALELVSDNRGKASLSANISKMADRDADVRIANEVLKLAGK
jgi:UDP-N-acetylglucosamine:LPS N-acetylglucosamine transferase